MFALYRKLSKDLDKASCVDLPAVAKLSEGLSGADLKAVLYSAQQARMNEGGTSNPIVSQCTRDQTSPGMDQNTRVQVSLGGYQETRDILFQEKLLQALQETKPSVSAADIEKYSTV